MSSSESTISCQVVKLTVDELEVRFTQTQGLRPGQLLRFERRDGNRVYGRLEGLRLEARRIQETDEPNVLAKIHVILGEADFTLTHAIVLSPEQVTADITYLLGTPQQALSLSQDITLDVSLYNTLTLIHGPALNDKLDILPHWLTGLAPYQHLLLIDPLGVISDDILPNHPHNSSFILRGGIDAGLSLQSVGIKRFLSVLSTMLPDVIRTDAMQLLAEVLPIGQTFVPFKELLRVETLTERKGDGPSRQALSMKTPLLNCLYDIDRQRVFADTPREVFSIQHALRSSITVIDLSSLSEPWKSLFYEEVCLEILANAGSDVMPVLIYPENYLSDFTGYVKKLNEAEISALAIASPYVSDDVIRLADTRMYWGPLGDAYLEGSLTFGLPLQVNFDGSTAQSHEADEGFDPIQARFNRQAPIATPAPSSQFYGESPYFSEHGIAQAAPDTSTLWQEKPVQQPDAENFRFDTPAQASDSFDSILGPINAVLTEDTPSRGILDFDEPDDAADEAAPKAGEDQQEGDWFSHIEVTALTTEELGGEVIRSEPEFIDADTLKTHAPKLAEAMANVLQQEEQRAHGQDSEQQWHFEDEQPAIQAQQHDIADDEEFNFELNFGDSQDEPARSVGLESTSHIFEPEFPVNAYEEPESSILLAEAPPILPKQSMDLEEAMQEEDLSFQPGDEVISDKYGHGVVQKVIPMESASAVHVLFDNGTKRTIVPSATNLQKC